MSTTRVAPFTLVEAHELLSHRRPRLGASLSAWAKFHRYSAEVYERAAESDTRHRHEASQWAAAETRRAQQIEHAVTLEGDGA